jgi:hypothetical protein
VLVPTSITTTVSQDMKSLELFEKLKEVENDQKQIY